MIQEDYSKVTEKIEKTEQAIDEIASNSINLEVKLTQMMNLIWASKIAMFSVIV